MAVVAVRTVASLLTTLIKHRRWITALAAEFSKAYFLNIVETLLKEKAAGKQVFPANESIFNCLNRTDLKDVKVVLLGQDPYPTPWKAMGLCFSVPNGVKVPRSLVNIYKELSTDIPGFVTPQHGNLEKWTDQGVLMLNATLTVQAGVRNSHRGIGWMVFTDQIIKTVSDTQDGVVFMLWGNFAHKKENLIDSSKHTILKTGHPSPLSYKHFEGCKCFSQANAALEKAGKEEIDWTL